MIVRIEEALGKLLSDPSAAVREAASGAMDRTLAKRSVEDFRSRILGGTVEEKLRAIYAAADLGGSEGVSLLLQALSDRDA
jgi:HEAT repeat protein